MSGRRGSNPRPWAWEAHALPTELLPHLILRQRYVNFVYFARIKYVLVFFTQKYFKYIFKSLSLHCNYYKFN